MCLRHAERLGGGVGLDIVTRVRAADVRAKRTGEAVGIFSIKKVVALCQQRIVAVRREHQRRATWPSSDKARRQPDHASGILFAAASSGFPLQELPETGDIL